MKVAVQVAHIFGYFDFQNELSAGLSLEWLESLGSLVKVDIGEFYRLELEVLQDRTAKCTFSDLQDTLWVKLPVQPRTKSSWRSKHACLDLLARDLLGSHFRHYKLWLAFKQLSRGNPYE